VLEAKYKHVVPYLNDGISIPGDDRRAVCQAIVDDLRFNIDRRIDSIVNAGIAAHAMPGCQVVVMHKGRVVLDRCYGHLTYDEGAPAVDDATVYDLASLTKPCATTLAMMKLVEDGKIAITDRLSTYLPYLNGTNKEGITIREVMSHCARLKAFDSYWQQTTDRDSLLRLVAASPLNTKSGYLYSDLGFMLLSDMVMKVTGQSLDQYVYDNFYGPMGLTSTCFNPTSKTIAPTEVDSLRGLITGTVHDPNAYAMGGVSGHAGLFSNAREVALLMQMLLNGGELNGHRYLKEKTVATFTSRHFAKQNNRRALGFDKQLFTPSASAQTCPEASQASYGHTGFTGTMLWVDPDYSLVYVFLSNRVHPSATPNRLAQMNTRTQIQSLLYNDIRK
jgi:CubicO group peptidase (beta-lactamase class C family)